MWALIFVVFICGNPVFKEHNNLYLFDLVQLGELKYKKCGKAFLLCT